MKQWVRRMPLGEPLNEIDAGIAGGGTFLALYGGLNQHFVILIAGLILLTLVVARLWAWGA